jgi:hypothetical protein
VIVCNPARDMNIWRDIRHAYILCRIHVAKGNTMMQLVTSTLLLSLVASGAWAQSAAHPKKHLFVFKSEHMARQRCPNDRIVWADTRAHLLHLPGDHHFAHTHGGFACESEAIALGYRAPTTHT